MIENIVDFLKSNKYKISFVESVTGGAITSKFIEVSGVSEVFEESYILYSSEKKIAVLGVSEALIKTYTVVSKEVAIDMANKLRSKTNADMCVSITGYAEGFENNHAYIAISYKNDCLYYKIDAIDGNHRIKNINYYVQKTIEYIHQTIA